MTDDAFQIMYAAHTASCTFLLDAEGICRRIVVTPGSSPNLAKKGRDTRSMAARCVGAQYVASLDPAVTGLLAEKPRVGASMLFARVDERGRVSLVRTGVVTRLETYREDPFAEPAPTPSTSVETSAPPLMPSERTRAPRQTLAPPPAGYEDPYGEGLNERTQQIHALRPATLFRALSAAAAEVPAEEHPTLDRAKFDLPEHPTLDRARFDLPEHPTLDRAKFDLPEPRTVRQERPSTPAIAEAASPAPPPDRPSERPAHDVGDTTRRSTWRPLRRDLDEAPPTIRQGSSNDEHDLYAALARGPLPRPKPPALRPRSDRVRASAEPSLHALDRLAVRRGGLR